MLTSMWTSTANWFTPTILFCIMNLMIAIIFIASNFKTHNNKQHPGQLVRAPSLLDRVKSINFSLYSFTPENQTHYEESTTGSDQTVDNSPGQLVRTPSLLERVKSINFSLYKTQELDPFLPETQPNDQTHDGEEEGDMGLDSHVTRSKSYTCGEIPTWDQVKMKVKMKKSASEKAMVESREEIDRRRPATVRERKVTASFREEEGGVDEKADNFISRFRQQLKLQRMDSIQRYREMLGRGSSS